MPKPERPLSSEQTAGFVFFERVAYGKLPEDFKKVIAEGLARPDRHENAAGKKLCGMCCFKQTGKWACGNISRFKCPTEGSGKCLGFSPKLLRKKDAQGSQKKSLPVPAGVKFLYIGAPKGKTKKGVLQHQGVVTVAWIESSPGLLCVAFSFCSPADPWYKATGRDMAIRRLNEHSLVIPFLYDAKRTVHEVTRAVLSHDFKRLEVVAKTRVILIKGPSWTRNLAKRMETKRVSGLSRLFPFPIPIPLTIIAHMMADIDKLGR